MYGPMSELINKPSTKSLGSFLEEKQSKTTRKQVFYTVFFFPFCGHLGTHKCTQTCTQSCKWAGYMAPCLSLKISPKPNDWAHYYRQNGPKRAKNRFLCCFWVILGLFGHPQMDSKRLPKAHKWVRCMA
jgi:hypothetical protein